MQNEPRVQRIFVGGLSRDINEEELNQAFEQHGEIIDCSIAPRRGYGFVSFRHKVDAEKAIEDMNGRYLGFHAMKVEWATGWPKDYPPIIPQEISNDKYEEVSNQTVSYNCTVHCKGLKSNTTKEMLQEVFRPFGEIEEIQLCTKHSDFAFIRFNTKEAATRAICSISNTEINGSEVKCKWSYKPEYRGPEYRNNNWLVASSTSSSTEFSSESSRSSSPTSLTADGMDGDEFDRVFNDTVPFNHTVYCGGLVKTVTREIIEEVFSPFGIIEDIELFVGQADYGFISFNTKEAATLAICAIDGTHIHGSPVRCRWSNRFNSLHVPSLEASAIPSPEPNIPPDISGLEILDPFPKDESDAKEKSNLCKICMVEKLAIVFLDCNHLISCAQCAEEISICPVCGKSIVSKVRTYLV